AEARQETWRYLGHLGRDFGRAAPDHGGLQAPGQAGGDAQSGEVGVQLVSGMVFQPDRRGRVVHRGSRFSDGVILQVMYASGRRSHLEWSSSFSRRVLLESLPVQLDAEARPGRNGQVAFGIRAEWLGDQFVEVD